MPVRPLTLSLLINLPLQVHEERAQPLDLKHAWFLLIRLCARARLPAAASDSLHAHRSPIIQRLTDVFGGIPAAEQPQVLRDALLKADRASEAEQQEQQQQEQIGSSGQLFLCEALVHGLLHPPGPVPACRSRPVRAPGGGRPPSGA
jgi:hypothetical protein